MPIVALPNGKYRYGNTGKVYSGKDARERAKKQGVAIELSKLRQEGKEVGGKIRVKGNSIQRGYIRKK